MSYEQSTADVADDYRLALEDLNSINKADISTLTTIARENTEHAQGITDVLQKHIVKAPPHKKLPAIYVLDSIVKNVGTPYTLFFGAQLYKTFMEAYLAVDGHVRRKMEETLRTWKQPVPQSLDDRPVFPPDITQPIEDALNRARSSAAAIQAQTHGNRPGYPVGRARGVVPNRATPTPPGIRPGSIQTGYQIPPHHLQPTNGSRPSSTQQQAPHPSAAPFPLPTTVNAPPGSSAPSHYQTPNYTHGTGTAGPYQASGVDVETLKHDIEKLINITQMEAAHNRSDQGMQQRLKGLQDLKTVLQIQSVPQDQLVLIKNQVADLAPKVRPSSAQSSHDVVPVHYNPPPPASATPVVVPPPSTGASHQQSSVTLDALLGKGALAALLSRQSATPQVSTSTPPPASFGNVPIRSPQPPLAELQQYTSTAPSSDPMALLAGLRKAGLLSATPIATPPVPTPAYIPPPSVPPTLSAAALSAPPGPGMPMLPPGLLPPNLAKLLSGGLPISIQLMDTIQLNAASLKNEFRPHLLPSLYDALGPQCSQCGRRFTKDEEGQKKKTAHMDWHFQVHHRLAEAERRGQHRSWYVDSADWIKSREVVDADHAKEAADAASHEADSAQGKESKPRFIVVPDASAGVNTTCPICQEKFENKWLDAAQEWVWLDTMLVSNRAYHVSCHSEATRARDTTPARSTPEPLLGKRKAEDELKNLRKIKMDGS